MPKQSKKRDKVLTDAIAALRKKWGDGAVMILGKEKPQDIEVIPTGSLALDLALGVGGMPRGRMTEIYGPEMAGKTTLCYQIIAVAQKAGGVCAFIDAENNMDPFYAEDCGVNVGDLIISQPDFGEEALEIAAALIRTGAVDVIAIDSVAGLVPRAEAEGEIGDTFVGLQARMMSQACRMLSGAIRKSRAVVIFTNQVRMKIGVRYGNPETTPGGKALRHYTAIRLDLRRKKPIKNSSGVIIGSQVRAFTRKNKVAAPFKTALIDLIFGRGFSRAGDIVKLGMEHGIVERRGSFYAYGSQTLGRGLEKTRAFLEENSEVADEIEKGIREAIGGAGE